MKNDNSMYYSLSKVLSYQSLLNFLIGERGVGKSFSITEFLMKQFINKGYQFAYVRRYKKELKDGCATFFDSVLKEKGNSDIFKNHIFEFKNGCFMIDDKVAGFAFTLSTAQDLKGSNYDGVKYIFFDEYIIEKGQKKYYLNNEVDIFLGLVETTARLRDIKIFCVGNAVNFRSNPYTLFFGLDIPFNSDIKTFKDGLILVQIMNNQAYREFKKNTKFGKLVAGTSYEDYAINNSFKEDNKEFVEKKTSSASFNFSIIYKNNQYGVWFDYKSGKIYVSNDYQDNGIVFATTLDDFSINTMFLSVAKDYYAWKVFIKNFRLGNVRYESLKIKSACDDILKYIIK